MFVVLVDFSIFALPVTMQNSLHSSNDKEVVLLRKGVLGNNDNDYVISKCNTLHFPLTVASGTPTWRFHPHHKHHNTRGSEVKRRLAMLPVHICSRSRGPSLSIAMLLMMMFLTRYQQYCRICRFCVSAATFYWVLVMADHWRIYGDFIVWASTLAARMWPTRLPAPSWWA